MPEAFVNRSCAIIDTFCDRVQPASLLTGRVPVLDDTFLNSRRGTWSGRCGDGAGIIWRLWLSSMTLQNREMHGGVLQWSPDRMMMLCISLSIDTSARLLAQRS
ncbi:hypothetical protein EDD15DRAFT_2203730 [Pisolithus albus]|nr:hypothetical protein EDD15DRAFT_2203730 [Pisolithus albus]